MTDKPLSPAQRLSRSLGKNPYSFELEAPTTEFEPVDSAAYENYQEKFREPQPLPKPAETTPNVYTEPLSPQLPTISVIAVQTATIFEGQDNVYRYDLPLSGLEEGWAIGPVLDQLRTMSGHQWPNIHVDVDVPGQAGTAVMNALEDSGVFARFAESVAPTHPPSPVFTSDEQATRGAKTKKFHPFHLAVGVVVLAVCGVSWWAIGDSDGNSVEQGGVVTDVAAPIEQDFEDIAPPPVDDPVVEEIPEIVEPELVSITQGLTSIELPPGYEVTKVGEDELVTLTGNDQEFRILMAANPMEEEKLSLANIAQRVANTSSLAARPDESFVGGRNVVSYLENPSDGSTAYWYVWGEAGHQMSVGCHWKQSVTPEREADCETAVRTLKLAE